MRPFLFLIITLISASSGAWAQNTKVVLEDMGNVGFRISDAQTLANWMSTGLRDRVGRGNLAYEGLLKARKDMQRRLGKTEIHPAQMEEIKRLEAFVAEATVWVKARFGKDKKGQWVEMTCRSRSQQPNKNTEKKRLYAQKFHDLQPAVSKALETFCSALIPPLGIQPNTSQATPFDPTHVPGAAPKKPKNWVAPRPR